MKKLDQIQLNFDSDSLFLLNICLAIIMFGIALDIRKADFQNLRKNPRAALIGIIGQFVLLPLATFLFVYLFEPLPSIALGLILVGACPGGNISNFLSHYSKSNSALSVSLTGVSTLLSLLMTPLNFELYAYLYPPTRALLSEIYLDPASVIKTIFLIMGLPLLAGLLVQNRLPQLANRVAPPLKKLSILIFLAFVVIAFANNIELFIHYIDHVLLLVALHNGMALLLGFYLGRSTRLSIRDSRTLAIETGIQNSGLGLVLVFAFFSGLGGMALTTAWWGIWDIIAGLSIAAYWNRHPAPIVPASTEHSQA